MCVSSKKSRYSVRKRLSLPNTVECLKFIDMFVYFKHQISIKALSINSTIELYQFFSIKGSVDCVVWLFSGHVWLQNLELS